MSTARGGAGRVRQQGVQRAGHVGRITRDVQAPGPLPVEQFGKRAVGGGDDGQARGHGLDDGQALRLRMRRGHREHVDRAEQVELARQIHLAEPAEAVGHTERLGPREAARDVVPLRIDRRAGSNHLDVVPRGDQRERLDEPIEPLLRARPRQISHALPPSPALPPQHEIGRRGRVQLEIDAVRDHDDPLPRHVEIVRHEAGIERVEGDEAIDIGGPLAEQGANAGVVRRRNLLDEDVLARQRAHGRRPRRRLHRACQSHEQRVRQVHHVRASLRREPAGELRHLLPLVSPLPLERRDRERPEVRRTRAAGAPRQPPEQRRRVEPSVEKRRRVPEERDILLEPDVHAPHDHPRLGDVLLVGRRGHVGGHEQRVAAAPSQGPHERVVVQARPADAATGAGGDVDDPHQAPRPSRCTSTSARSAGVTPRTRPAWPSVSGRILSSCSRASARRCRTPA